MRSSATLMLVVFTAILLGVAGSAIAASNDGHEALQACLCEELYRLENSAYGVGTYTVAWAYVEGWTCVPSNGDLYGVEHDWWVGIIRPPPARIIVVVIYYYIELGCWGDEAGTIVITYIDWNGNGWPDPGEEDAGAHAWIKAGPCCAT